MSSQRITKGLAEQIAESATSKAFDAKLEVLRKARAKAGDALYKLMLGEHYKAVNKLPEAFFPLQDSLYLGGSNSFSDLHFSKPTRMVTSSYYLLKAIPKSDPLVIAYAKADNEVEIHRSLRRDFYRKVLQIASSVTTTSRLLEVWPEGKEFVPAASVPTSNLPMVLISDVNAVLSAAA